jgi:CheY-like chemotaxis protein
MGASQHMQKTVLVVEDMPLIRLDAVSMFEDMGFWVLEAADGREALEVLETSNAISILFTDIEMPNLGGLELAAIVAERWPDIDIVITSGRLEPRADDLPDEARFVSKPYDLRAIARIMG